MEVQIEWAIKEQQAAIGRGVKATDVQVKNNCFKQAGDFQSRIKKKTEELSRLQAKLAKCMEKKPREKQDKLC